MPSTWSDLPSDILLTVCSKLILPEDLFSIALVCTQWCDVVPTITLPPVLIVGNCCGASQGWLITMHVTNSRFMVQLVNPFSSTNSLIQLPDLRHEEYIWKAILSHNPSSTSNYIVMIIYKYCGDSNDPKFGLAYFTPNVGGGGGEESWTRIDGTGEKSIFRDIIYHRDRFYAISFHEMLCISDIRTTTTHKVISLGLLPTPCHSKNRRTYLVESSTGNVLLYIVRKFHTIRDERTLKFQIFEFQRNGNNNWLEVRTLENEAIFLGYVSSLSMQAAQWETPRPSCIYFVEHDSKYIRVKEGFVKPLPGMHCNNIMTAEGRFPNWVQPIISISRTNNLNRNRIRMWHDEWAIVKLNKLNKWSRERTLKPTTLPVKEEVAL